MGKLHSDVKKLLEEAKTWVLSTCDDKPNAVPVFFTSAKDDELVIFDVFMAKTLDNIKKNSQVAITVFNDSTMQGYQVKGIAQYSSDASLIEAGNAVTGNFNLTTKGAVIVQPQEVYVLSPGPDNGKQI
ncbi:MAG: pyridoxamine 5'-phosphate oxidase family protein [Clostridiales bacterium]|nr:pyridoxamine 5'-phosphate oxidase family protein [Clostridiales bacterium]